MGKFESGGVGTQAHASERERSLAARESEMRKQELDFSEDTNTQRLELSEEMRELVECTNKKRAELQEATERAEKVRVVHLGRSTCHAISGRED